jgi:hypothetical protein
MVHALRSPYLYLNLFVGLKDGKWNQTKGMKLDKGWSRLFIHVIRQIGPDSDADAKKNIVTNSILYVGRYYLLICGLQMPYLHWAQLHDHNRGTKERYRDWVKNCKQPNVHPRRSLDEAALRPLSYNSLMERNCDQVVTHSGCKAETKRTAVIQQ